MLLSKILLTVSSFLLAVTATDNGLQTVVTWDKYSLLVNDSRVFILCVFHISHVIANLLIYEKLRRVSLSKTPSPRVMASTYLPIDITHLMPTYIEQDIFQKYKANGYNTVR